MSDKGLRSPIKWMIVGLAIGIVLLFSFVYVTSEPDRPKPRITSESGYESFQDSNRTYVVNVTVINNGYDGWVKVSARIYVVGRYMKQVVRLYLATGESEELQFAFDISFWGARTSPFVSHRAWTAAD